MLTYRAIALDLCNTLCEFRLENLPVARIDGREVRTTAPLLYPLIREAAPQVEERTFLEAFQRTSVELDAKKREEGREIPPGVRFYRLLERLGIPCGDRATDLVLGLTKTHAEALLSTMHCPPSHRELIWTLAGRYRLALITNFDHPQTVRRLLERDEMADCFRALAVSGDVGWRKPRPEIFRTALKGLDAEPGECLLVGDDFDNDVRGAAGVGMPAVWLTPHPLKTEGLPAVPTIRALPELLSFLE